MCSWVSFMIMLVLCFSFNGVSYARHRKHPHPAATLVGTVYCDTCFRKPATKSTHFISGATVAVECGSGSDGGKPSFREEVKTNENGDFEAKLPVSVGKSLEKIKGCSVRLISSGKPYCSVAATATSSEIRLKSKKAGTHIFSAGFFTFKPELCDEKDFVGKDFPPSLPDPPAPFLPPIGDGLLPPLPVPDLPIPPLVPPLPRLPGITLPPINIPIHLQRQKPDKFSDRKTFGFPPTPPFQPSAPSLLPPLLPLPPLNALLPPVLGLGLTPSPTASAVPVPVPVQIPRTPTNTIPGFPPVSPTTVSSLKSAP